MLESSPNFNLLLPNKEDEEQDVADTLKTNFETIDTELKNRQTELETHQSATNAHESVNIKHGDGNVQETLFGFEGRIGDVEAEVEDVDSRISTIVAQAGTDNTEIVDARGGFTVLHDRLESIDNQLVGLAVDVQALGAHADGFTDDAALIQNVLNDHRRIHVPSGVYKINAPLNVPPNTEVTFADGAVFDMTALTSGTGFTTRIGSKFENVHLRYSHDFTGNGWYFTTIDNGSSTSVNNADSNEFIAENTTIEKVMPTTGIAWDWYTTAAGTAFVMDGQDNPDGAITSGFWGGLVDNLLIKGVWLQSGLVQDDGTGWITSSTVRHVIMDGPRRGFQIASGGGATPKSGNLNFYDFHMQGWRWAKSGETDVTTEWMLKVDSAAYCHFRDFQPQDFSSAMGIQNFIQFGANSKKCSFESMYIVADTDIQDFGQNNRMVTPLGTKFPNLAVSSDVKTLDWYEEGEFTVNVIGSTTPGSCTYTTRKGSFVRIGKTVRVSIEVGWTGHTGAGNLRVGTLPFSSNAGDASSVFQTMASGLSFGTGQLVSMLGKGGTTVDIYSFATGAGTLNVGVDTDVSMLRITGTYTV